MKGMARKKGREGREDGRKGVRRERGREGRKRPNIEKE